MPGVTPTGTPVHQMKSPVDGPSRPDYSRSHFDTAFKPADPGELQKCDKIGFCFCKVANILLQSVVWLGKIFSDSKTVTNLCTCFSSLHVLGSHFHVIVIKQNLILFFFFIKLRESQEAKLKMYLAIFLEVKVTNFQQREMLVPEQLMRCVKKNW